MSKFKMDAEMVGSLIHKGDFSKLRGKSFEMCDNTNMGKKYTLNQLGMTVDKLVVTVNDLTKVVKDLANDFYSFKKEITTRLDYIVKTNNLKDSPRSK